MNIYQQEKTPLIEEEAHRNRKMLICQNYRRKRKLRRQLAQAETQRVYRPPSIKTPQDQQQDICQEKPLLQVKPHIQETHLLKEVPGMSRKDDRNAVNGQKNKMDELLLEQEKGYLLARDGLKSNIKDEVTIKSKIYDMNNLEIPDCCVMFKSQNRPNVKTKQSSTIEEIPTGNGEDKLEERTKPTHCSTPIDGIEHCEEALKKTKGTTEPAAGTSALICAASPVLSISVPLTPSSDDASTSVVPPKRVSGKRKIFIENWELLTPIQRSKKFSRMNTNIKKNEKRRAHQDIMEELVREIMREIIEAEVRHAATMEELADEKQNIIEAKLEKCSLPARDGLKTNIKEEIIIKSAILDNPEAYNMDNLEIPDCLVMSESQNILETHPFVKTEQPSTSAEIPAGNNEDKDLDLLPIIKTDIYNVEDDESTEFFIKTENCDSPNIITKYNVEIIPDKPIPNLHKLKERAESTQNFTPIEDIQRCEELLIKMKELQDSAEDVVSCMFCRTKMLKKCSLAHLLESHNFALDIATILLPTSFQK